MKLAFFSDVHANLPALEAVLEDIDRRRPDMVFCLGDLVGYAPWPNEVVEAVRARGIPTIAGNYDEGVGLDSDDCGCAYRTDEDRRRGAESIAFTNETVIGATRDYLRALPRHLRMTFQRPRAPEAPAIQVLMVHGGPRRINEYLFEDRPDESFVRMMTKAEADVMLFGHTHKPYHKRLAAGDGGTGRTLHAINIGSVGKPKDGDPRACYTIVETAGEAPSSTDPSIGATDDVMQDVTQGMTHGEPDDGLPGGLHVEFVRVPYDVERAAREIEGSPLPNAFADMLREAR